MMKAINDDDGKRHLFPRLFRAHHGALLLFVPGNTFRDKGLAGHGERIQRPASRFRFAKDGEMQIADLSGQSGQAGIDRGEHEDHDQHAEGRSPRHHQATRLHRCATGRDQRPRSSGHRLQKR
jgi:hypothetical protein